MGGGHIFLTCVLQFPFYNVTKPYRFDKCNFFQSTWGGGGGGGGWCLKEA